MKLSQKVRHHVFFWDTVYIILIYTYVTYCVLHVSSNAAETTSSMRKVRA